MANMSRGPPRKACQVAGLEHTVGGQMEHLFHIYFHFHRLVAFPFTVRRKKPFTDDFDFYRNISIPARPAPRRPYPSPLLPPASELSSAMFLEHGGTRFSSTPVCCLQPQAGRRTSEHGSIFYKAAPRRLYGGLQDYDARALQVACAGSAQ